MNEEKSQSEDKKFKDNQKDAEILKLLEED